MTPQLNLALFNEGDEMQPLPLQVAKFYDFPLQYHTQSDDALVYAVQDWIAGLTGETDSVKVSDAWRKFKNQTRISIPTLKLPYRARDGKTYKRDFTPDVVLYGYAAYARATNERPQLQEIKDFLAKAGAFVDELRQDSEAAQQAIANHRQTQALAAGRPASWVNAREMGIMTRNELTALLVTVCPDINIGEATNITYKGTLGHDAKGLRAALHIGPKQNPRDHLSEIALIYTMATEAAVRAQLSDYAANDPVPPHVVRNVIQTIAQRTGKQAQETATLIGIDLVTGQKVLAAHS